MKNIAAPHTPAPAEKLLNELFCTFEKLPDGALSVPGSLSLSSRNLTALPDLSSVTVKGNFSCNNNALTSLAGAPSFVGGDFNCSSNQLTSLYFAPKQFKSLKSDMGTFDSWGAIPEVLRMAPPDGAALAQESSRSGAPKIFH